MIFRLPDYTHRTAILGRTGSGKTQFGAWLLSMSPFHKQPYVIVDYKGDELLNSIEKARHITFKDTPPKHPGLYLLKALPSQKEEMENWLWSIWKKEKIGLMFDEAYEIPDFKNGGAFRSILTQGRAKRIPVICCSQRPTWVSQFIFSEADFFSVMHLQIKNDIKRVEELTPIVMRRLPDYHSHWYDVGKDQSSILKPVPNAETILQTFDDRLRRGKHFI